MIKRILILMLLSLPLLADPLGDFYGRYAAARVRAGGGVEEVGLPLEDYIQVYYPLDGSGADLSTNGYHATAYNAPTSTNDAIRGTAYFFNESLNQYFEASNLTAFDGATKFTFSFWAKRPDNDQNNTALSLRNGTSLYGMVQFLSCDTYNGVGIRSYFNKCNCTDENGVDRSGAWHHFAWTYDGAQMVGFADGSAVASNNIPSLSLAADISNLNIGALYSNTQKTHGYIDEVIGWSTNLTTAQIAEVYNRDAP